jgi:hypothetical protein
MVDAGQAADVVVVAFWQQNTATRKLAMEMLDSLFRRARETLDIPAQTIDGLRPSYARAK